MRIDRYRIGHRLGAGAMGVVYAARDLDLAREVALKVVRPRADAAAMQVRLRREAQAMARLSHPNVVPVFDIGTHDDQIFVAMELIAGETLRAWMRRRPPWRDVVRLFVRAGLGLEAAHAAGLVHRDFKPDNVMVGAGDQPRITDFGLAREHGESAAAGEALAAGEANGCGAAGEPLPQVTMSGSIAGTPVYMAPEQLLGRASGPAADQFSFCVSLFEALYGERPFQPTVAEPAHLLAKIHTGQIAKPEAARGVPGWLHAAVVRGLVVDPEQRWPSMRALVAALERGLARRRARRIAWIAAPLVAGGGVLALLAAPTGRVDPAIRADCERTVREGNEGLAVVVCRDEYARTGDPRTGARLANALRRSGDLRTAAAAARGLLATAARADALYTLGKIASQEGHDEDAERALRLAAEQHRADGRWSEAAKDLLATSELVAKRRDFAAALLVLDEGVRDARRASDRTTEGYCHLGAARVLSQLGVPGVALRELDRAGELFESDGDRTWLYLERGNVLQEIGDNARAVPALAQALALAERESRSRSALTARLNLAYSLAELGRVPEAAAQLDAARALDPEDRKIFHRAGLAARVAARRGALAEAAAHADRALAAPGASDDDLLERELLRTEIALEQGALPAAESWARRAVERVEAARAGRSPIQARARLAAERRAAYELLFASVARRGDAAAALVVLDRWRGRAILDELARAGGAGEQAPALAAVAGRIRMLEQLLPGLETSALAKPAAEDAILGAARAAPLLALVVARDELWRITSIRGELRIANAGAAAPVREQVDRLAAAPGDPVLSAALGALLVPAELARPGAGALRVILDEPLARLSIGGLRVGGRALSAVRPVVHAARPSEAGCVPARGEARAAVVAGAATRAALFAAEASELLHVGVRAEAGDLGPSLVLRDGRATALELAGRRHAPARVVLATPGVTDGGGYVLAMAFVAAGAGQVIASLGPVSDGAAARLAEALDRPAAAADHPEPDWSAYAVFGRATCSPTP